MKTELYTDQDKNILFDHLLTDELEVLINIDTVTGLATTIHAESDKWKATLGIEYPFEETIRNFFLSSSADPKTGNLITAMDLKHITKHLEECGSYKVFYSSLDEKALLRQKKASFYQRESGKIWFLIRDVSDDYNGIASSIGELNHSIEQMVSQLEQKNTFLNLMSRNIRTPLYSIMGLTKIKEQDAGSNTSLNAYLHKISMSGTYMSETIDDILELRRIASREIILAPETVCLKDILKHTEQIIRPICQSRGLFFAIQADCNTGLVLNTDPTALQQILLKLLQSSINYTVKGGRIQLNVHEMFRRNNTVTLEFSADCIGIVIDSERLKGIFQPYHFLLQKIDEDPGSLDISLIILKKYASALGADTLTAETDETKGTTVSLTLTFNLSEQEAETEAEPSMEDILLRLKDLKVLVVDDNEINLEVNEKILTGHGIHVVTAANGQEAIDIFQKANGNFDLIMMDILMPVMDGLEATKQIRKMNDIPNAGEIPIIAMTANALHKNFEESLQAGMNAHLVKPINHENLFRAIDKVLSRS